MGSFRFADILLTLVVLLITFAILYVIERARSKSRKKIDDTNIAAEKKPTDN